MTPANLLQNLPEHVSEERFDTLLQTPGLRLQRIISTGQATPHGQWYDQSQDEWVLVLTGSASLRFESGKVVELQPGDYLHIPAGQRHRVERTDPQQPTVWLALHFSVPESD